MGCLFRHDWIYKNITTGKTYRGNDLKYYTKRICFKCGKTQENNPHVDTSFGGEDLVNKWATIGYSSQNTRETKQ